MGLTRASSGSRYARPLMLIVSAKGMVKCADCGEILISKRKIFYGTRLNPLVCARCKKEYRLELVWHKWKKRIDFLVTLTFPFVAFWLVGIWDSFIPAGIYLLAILVAELFYQLKAPFVVVEK